MRYGAPRSVSPSPVRGQIHRNTFGLASDSDSDEYVSEVESSFHDSDLDDDNSVASTSSASSSSYNLVSDINKLAIRPKNIALTPLEERQIEETVAAIRARTRYHDPYEEWEQETRRDAFRTARKDFSASQTRLSTQKEHLDTELERRRLEKYEKVTEEVAGKVKFYQQKLQESNAKLVEQWQVRDRALWERIEASIKHEEEKVAKRLEEERKLKEEEEKLIKELELKRRLAAEKRAREEAKKKEEEEEKARIEKEREEEEKRVQELEEKARTDEAELWTRLNLAPLSEDWRVARLNLQDLKNGPLAWVKEHKEQKSEWSTLRRQITPKIGQLTNDKREINRITQQIIDIMRMTERSGHQNSIYPALASSLAKAILLQAETEVIAEKRAADPLAQVTFNLLQTLPQFGAIFFSKLVQRCGGWPIPTVVPHYDNNKRPWKSNEEYTKVSGWRNSTSGEGIEKPEEYTNRISALMRVYFKIIKISCTANNVDRMFQMPRCWVWFSRIMNEKRLLVEPVGVQLIYVGLEVLGLDALKMFGNQWVKMLMLINEGATNGLGDGKLIGGDSPLGAAARARVKLALENIIKGEQT